MTLIDPRFIGKPGPAHPSRMRTDTLNRADNAAHECDCAGPKENANALRLQLSELRLTFRQLADELDTAGDDKTAHKIRARL